MSFWLRVDPGRPRHPKWANLSDEEYRFADELLCWGAEHETDVIPSRVLFKLAGSPRRGKRLAKALVEAGGAMPLTADGSTRHGILEPMEVGWRIHDAQQYWPPAAQIEASAVAAREELSRKRAEAGRRGGQRSVEARREAHGSAMPKQTAKQPEANSEATRGPSPTPPPLQNGNENDQAAAVDPKPSRHFARVREDEQQPPRRIACPSPVDILDAKQRSTLVTGLIPEWAIDALLLKFCAKYADGSKLMAREQWSRAAVTAVTSDWNDPNKRPKQPATGERSAAEIQRTARAAERVFEQDRERRRAECGPGPAVADSRSVVEAELAALRHGGTT